METEMKTSELIKQCIAMAAVFVGVIAYISLVVVQPALL